MSKNKADGISAKLSHNYTPAQTGRQWFFWGETDTVPQQCEDIANNNGIFRKVMDKLCQYVVGQGFKDKALNDKSVKVTDPNETLLKFIRSVAKYCVFYDGAFAVQVRRDRTGKVAHLSVIDIGKLRLSQDVENPHWIYNKYRGRLLYTQSDDVYIPEYKAERSPEAVLEMYEHQKKTYGHYYGEVYVHYLEDVGVPFYPIPRWFSSSEIIYGNSSAAKAFLHKAKTQFIPSVIVSTQKLDESRPDDNTLSDAEKFSRNLKSQLDSDEPRTMFHVAASSKDAMPQITTLDVTDLPKALVEVLSESSKLMCQMMGVDPALIGFATEGQLGNNQQLATAEGMLNELARVSYRLPMMDALKPLLEAIGITGDLEIEDVRMYSYIPDNLMEVLSVDEKRKLLGYEPLPKTTPQTEPEPVTNPQ